MRIGEVAKRVGISVETIRFYEKHGLIETAKRNESGYRIYGPKNVEQLFFIVRAKELGFTLKEIRDLLRLRFSPDASCAEIREQAERKIADIEERISALGEIKAALEELARRCPGAGSLGQCPIIEALDKTDSRR